MHLPPAVLVRCVDTHQVFLPRLLVVLRPHLPLVLHSLVHLRVVGFLERLPAVHSGFHFLLELLLFLHSLLLVLLHLLLLLLLEPLVGSQNRLCIRPLGFDVVKHLVALLHHSSVDLRLILRQEGLLRFFPFCVLLLPPLHHPVPCFPDHLRVLLFVLSLSQLVLSFLEHIESVCSSRLLALVGMDHQRKLSVHFFCVFFRGIGGEQEDLVRVGEDFGSQS
mmetsp:Transcript_2874/g.5934  ORF Transcript_2874/g.5934 Transcript_2874/m.5934 type:complete len:221 (+) Transcript_2874:341-1003(+)